MKPLLMCAGLLLAVNSQAYELHYWYESGGYEGSFDGRLLRMLWLAAPLTSACWLATM